MKRIWKGAALTTSALACLACGGVMDRLSGGPDIPVALELSGDDMARAEALALSVSDGHIPSEQCRDKANASLFVWIAASETEPATRSAALECMGRVFTHSASVDTKQLIDDDYRLVVRALMSARDDVVRARAIQAARISIDGDSPDPETVALMIERARSDEPRERYEAIRHLWYMDAWEKDDKAAGAYIEALYSSEPWILSEALFRIRSNYYNLVEAERAVEKATALLDAQDPGVRGRAARAAGALAGKHGDADAIGDAVHALLADEHPYVRSEAAAALASLKRLASIHRLMELIEDEAENTYELEGFTLLDGGEGRVHHDGSAWSRVDDAAFSALKSMSYTMDDSFDYSISHDTKAEDFERAREEARRWYQDNLALLPPDEDQDEDEGEEAGRGKAGKGSKAGGRPDGKTGPRVRPGKGGKPGGRPDGKAGKR